ncbi:helix-turn-helix transcriptional regulator [Actinacidiphila glaucinigra]|uniref:helix-turn-helix transcriptional regulator n=1 Tax=Actinacidiphila glaucinigra TaxID=235986 RepID=UPI003811DA50
MRKVAPQLRARTSGCGGATRPRDPLPPRPWTTAALARVAGVSRATLDRRFAAATDESPGAYPTRWRMDLAARRLCDTQNSLGTIAAAVGHSSGYALSQAFHRARSQPPGQFNCNRSYRREPDPDRCSRRPCLTTAPRHAPSPAAGHGASVARLDVLHAPKLSGQGRISSASCGRPLQPHQRCRSPH